VLTLISYLGGSLPPAFILSRKGQEGIPSFEESFPLRCLQRLSRRNTATQPLPLAR